MLPHDQTSVDLYLSGIKEEWESKKDLLSEVVTLYLGGGTPSLLTVKQLEYLLNFLPHGEEITIEANPDDVTLEKMQS